MRITDYDPRLDKPLTIKDRAALYNSKFYELAKVAPLCATERWLYGFWMTGQDYRKKNEYYGGYPSNYLDRVFSLFPDCDRVMHLFSGMVGDAVLGDKVDINPEREPDIVADAHELSQSIDPSSYDLIIADPPYSDEDAKHYGTTMVNRNEVVTECAKVLKPGGFLVWLDQVLPMYRKKELNLVGVIGLIISTNHRVRSTFIWEKPRGNVPVDAFIT